MLSPNTIAQMNRRIQDDIRTLGSIISSPEEKEEARKNIAVLTEILNPRTEKTGAPSKNSLVDELCGLLRDRRR